MTVLTLTTDIGEWRLGILSQASHVHEDRLYETGRVAVNPNHRQPTPLKNGFRIEAGYNQISLLRLHTATIKACGLGNPAVARAAEFIRCPRPRVFTREPYRLLGGRRITPRGLRPASPKLTRPPLSQTSNKRPVSRSPMPFRTGASRPLCIRQTLRFKRLIAHLEWAMELPILQSFAHSVFAHRGAFKDQ
jgi:hypothetical protein